MEPEQWLKNKRNRNPHLFAPLPLPVPSGQFSVAHTAVGARQATVLSQPMISFSDTFLYTVKHDLHVIMLYIINKIIF